MGTVTRTIILISTMNISDISLVFLNYSLGIGLHTCLFKFDERADSKQSAQTDAHCNMPVRPKVFHFFRVFAFPLLLDYPFSFSLLLIARRAI